MKTFYAALLITLLSMPATALAEMEDWYAYWGIGLADTGYPEPLDSALDQLESTTDSLRLNIALDLLGFYFPVSERTIAGFIINGSGDRIDDGADNLQLNLYTYGLSMMHFTGREPGDGLFLRTDFGITKAVLTSSVVSGSVGSDNGTGYLVGIGYGIASHPQSRILLNLNYANRTIEDEQYKTVALSVGVLF